MFVDVPFPKVHVREETAQSIIDCSGRLSDLVKRIDESENPSKLSIDSYKSMATDSQIIDDFSSYKRNSEETEDQPNVEKTQALIELLMQD